MARQRPSMRVPRGSLILFIVFLCGVTLLNFRLLMTVSETREIGGKAFVEQKVPPLKAWLNKMREELTPAPSPVEPPPSTATPAPEPPTQEATAKPTIAPKPHHHKPAGAPIVVEVGSGEAAEGDAPSTAAPAVGLPIDNGGGAEGESGSDSEANVMTYRKALELFDENMHVAIPQDPKQPTKDFFDVVELPDHGILLPHDPSQTVSPELWKACDPRDAEFTVERDALCQQYLGNVNNIRSIKVLSAILKRGRTIKFKAYYRHGGIEGIVKISQNKFVFEAASEYLAFALDRELNITRTPTAVYAKLPLDYMRAASAVMGPFYTQWFHTFILNYQFTKRLFVNCDVPTVGQGKCSQVSIILWMSDVHSALMSTLAVPFEYDEAFAHKFLTPGHHKWPPKPLRLRAIGDICLRFAFDFLMGNTDRGMNDHNNFVYGGCDETSRCSPRPAEIQTKGIAKYAFIDHGSSFYSRQEPKENPFTGNMTDILVCRYRRSMRDSFAKYRSVANPQSDSEKLPLVLSVKQKLPKGLFEVVSIRVFEHVQRRLDKVLDVMDMCVAKYGEEEVYSLPEYWDPATMALSTEKKHVRHHQRDE